jgi:hypothetical protein
MFINLFRDSQFAFDTPASVGYSYQARVCFTPAVGLLSEIYPLGREFYRWLPFVAGGSPRSSC